MNWLSLIANRYTVGLLAIAVTLGAVYARGHRNGYAAGFAKEEKVYNGHLAADAAADELARNAARMSEFALAQANARNEQTYEQGKHDAETTANDVAAAERAGTLRLRAHWQGCEANLARSVSEAAFAAGQLDAAAELRVRDSSDLVRLGAKCDAEIRYHQATLIAERKALGVQP